LILACAGTRRLPEIRFGEEYLTARNGQLHYKLPLGWLNAAEEAPSSSDIIWLVRNDLAATLSVRELVIDSATRQEIDHSNRQAEKSGLQKVAELTSSLASRGEGATMIKPPEPITVNDTEGCVYEYMAGNSPDKVRVVLYDTGTKLYEIRMVATGSIGPDTASTLAALQKEFVRNLTCEN
jgi:hypothetical protein